MSRPARTWKWRWGTLCPAWGPQLDTTRKSVTPRSRVIFAMTSKAWATTAELSAVISPQEPMWALLHGRAPSLLIPALAVLLTGAVLAAAWRLDIPRRFLLPFGPTWKTGLPALAAFAAGAVLDTSYALFAVGDMAIGGAPFRLLCAAGSGVFLAAVVLALIWAARAFGGVTLPRGSVVLAAALAVNLITALYSAGTATVFYWDTNIYWSSSTMLAGQPLDLAQLRLVAESVITQEYNYLLSFPISLVMRIFGAGHYVFLFAVVNLYVLPALLGMLALGRRSPRGGVLLCLAAPMLLYTALTGFVDVAADAKQAGEPFSTVWEGTLAKLREDR